MRFSGAGLKLLLATILASQILSAASCGFRFGDQAQTFRFDNRLDEGVTITYLYDGEDKKWGGTVIPPGAIRQEHVMIERKGVRVWGTTTSGAVVLDRHFLWDEIRPGETVTIVIE